MNEHTDIKQWKNRRWFQKKNRFKKHNYLDDVFRGVGFKTGSEGTDLYARTIERLGLYASTQFKNGADIKKCLKAGKVIEPKIPDLVDNHTAHKKRIWDHRVTEIMKTEQTLENNLCNLFAVLMLLCDSDAKNEYPKMEAELDSMKLLGMIKSWCTSEAQMT